MHTRFLFLFSLSWAHLALSYPLYHYPPLSRRISFTLPTYCFVHQLGGVGLSVAILLTPSLPALSGSSIDPWKHPIRALFFFSFFVY
jgi:hypothetical protein